MKKSDIITKIAFALIALTFTIIISRIVPNTQFEPCKLELDSAWKKENSEQEYWIDINNDQTVEKIRHHNINIIGHSVELRKDGLLSIIYIFKDNEQFIGKKLTFNDINGDLTKEILFVSFKDNTAYLNILSYNTDLQKFVPIEKVAIDTVKQHNKKPDAINNFLLVADSCIYLDLQGGYAVQPRNIYKYDTKRKTITKTKLNSLVTPEIEVLNYQGEIFLLATYVKSTANTISHKEAEQLKNSTNKDTLEIYNTLKHLEYSYGDFSSYILLYDNQLNFKFEPIEFFGWTNFTKAALITIDSIPHIVAFTNSSLNEPDNKRAKLVTICNLQGKILKQIPLPHNYLDVYTKNDFIIFYGEKTLYIKNKQLKVLNEITDITCSYGFVDLNNDSKSEFVAYRNNVLTIFSDEFDINATFEIEQEFAPYPEDIEIIMLQKNNKHSFLYNSRLFFYLFSYQKNSIAFLKYPFYITVFFAIFGVLFFIHRFNIKRLEKENQKLEQIVRKRTSEIATQKEEIENQAIKLKHTNQKLLELDTFKQGMTSMIVHDLKNPLNAIINASEKEPDKSLKHNKQTGKQMLNMVMNILDVHKYEETKMIVATQQTSLNKLADNSIHDVLFLARQKNIALKNKIHPQIKVHADIEIMERVFTNFLTNGIKYTPNNGTITIYTELSETRPEKQKQLTIKIADTGIGIPADKLDLVFAKFEQVVAKKSGSIRSTGLGMTFCKMAVEAHGGKIGVESEIGKGTTFWFTLELAGSIDENTTKTEPTIVENKLELTKEDKEYLKPYITKLKQLMIYEISELNSIVSTIDNTKNSAIANWVNELKNCIFAMNEEKYNELINFKI